MAIKLSKNIWLVLLLLIIGAAVIIRFSHFNDNQESPIIRLAENITPVSAPVTIAKEKKYFEANGLNCKSTPFASGRNALDALLGDKADFATVAETPIVLASMQGQPITVLCTFTSSEKNTKILARTDRGITIPKDLKTKRIGVSFGSNGAYFLDVFLKSNGLAQEDIQLVNLSAPDMAAALVAGEVDAICTWEPHILNAKKLLEKRHVVFGNNPGLYTQTFNIVAKQSFVKAHPEVVTSFLKSLLGAETFIQQNPKEAVAIVAKANNMAETDFQSIFKDYSFELTINQDLINALKGQAEWALRTNLAAPGSFLPPLERLLSHEPLQKINESSVEVK